MSTITVLTGPTAAPTADLTVCGTLTQNADLTFTVWMRWATRPGLTALDRPVTHGISTGHNRRLAERLVAAIGAGVITPDPQIVSDLNGGTYVACRTTVMGKYLNADLNRLGF